MISLEQFSEEIGVTLRRVRQLADKTNYTRIEHNGNIYPLIQSGRHPNGTPRYLVAAQTSKKYRHLTNAERSDALLRIAKGEAIDSIAQLFGCSYHSIYRLKQTGATERKVRTDKGTQRKGLLPDAVEMFKSIYIQNAQGPNVKLAFDLTMRQFTGFDMPIRYFKRIAREIEPLRLRHHQESRFDKQYAPRVRRDLWSEFEFLECVSLDGWVVPDRVLKNFGLSPLTEKKFGYNGIDVSMVCVFAFDSKTGYPLAWKAFERSVNQDDILSLLLDVVQRWGKPGHWLLDNGTEFTNEAVQRFLRGLYTTDEHEVKQRIVFSEPYQPYGKGRHERQHRIFKDEFCAFSESYSPNQQESRKPTKKLSHVAATQTLEQWTERFTNYLNGFYQERQRVSWMNPHRLLHHPDNDNRPRTLREAFTRAYATFTPATVDPRRLAFLYGKKFRAQIKQSLFRAPKSFGMGMRLNYLCTDIPFDRYNETFEIVVNPRNIAQAWVCDLQNNFIAEAWDIRARDAAPTREMAAQYRKQRNRVNKLAKEQAEISAQLVKVDDALRPATAPPSPVAIHDAEKEIYTSITVDNREPVEDEFMDDEMVENFITSQTEE